jgi:hypothetical protein
MIKSKNTYVTPEMYFILLSTEGLLCQSLNLEDISEKDGLWEKLDLETR